MNEAEENLKRLKFSAEDFQKTFEVSCYANWMECGASEAESYLYNVGNRVFPWGAEEIMIIQRVK